MRRFYTVLSVLSIFLLFTRVLSTKYLNLTLEDKIDLLKMLPKNHKLSASMQKLMSQSAFAVPEPAGEEERTKRQFMFLRPETYPPAPQAFELPIVAPTIQPYVWVPRMLSAPPAEIGFVQRASPPTTELPFKWTIPTTSENIMMLNDLDQDMFDSMPSTTTKLNLREMVSSAALEAINSKKTFPTHVPRYIEKPWEQVFRNPPKKLCTFSDDDAELLRTEDAEDLPPHPSPMTIRQAEPTPASTLDVCIQSSAAIMSLTRSAQMAGLQPPPQAIPEASGSGAVAPVQPVQAPQQQMTTPVQQQQTQVQGLGQVQVPEQPVGQVQPTTCPPCQPQQQQQCPQVPGQPSVQATQAVHQVQQQITLPQGTPPNQGAPQAQTQAQTQVPQQVQQAQQPPVPQVQAQPHPQNVPVTTQPQQVQQAAPVQQQQQQTVAAPQPVQAQQPQAQATPAPQVNCTQAAQFRQTPRSSFDLDKAMVPPPNLVPSVPGTKHLIAIAPYNKEACEALAIDSADDVISVVVTITPGGPKAVPVVTAAPPVPAAGAVVNTPVPAVAPVQAVTVTAPQPVPSVAVPLLIAATAVPVAGVALATPVDAAAVYPPSATSPPAIPGTVVTAVAMVPATPGAVLMTLPAAPGVTPVPLATPPVTDTATTATSGTTTMVLPSNITVLGIATTGPAPAGATNIEGTTGVSSNTTVLGGVTTITPSTGSYSPNSSATVANVTLPAAPASASVPVDNAEIQRKLVNILKGVESIKSKRPKVSEGLPCSVIGKWHSEMAGVAFNIEKNQAIAFHVQLIEAPFGEGFLKKMDWNVTARVPIVNVEMITMIATRQGDLHMATFTGECRTCNNEEVVTGHWLSVKPAGNCEEMNRGQDFFGDTWKRVNDA